MMKKLLLVLATCLPFTLPAQEKGIHFEHELSWKDVRAKAQKEGKFIFMDCYTTWCGPCKMMSRDIFPQQAVGDFFNDKFISVKVQMDKTAKDDDAVKRWYDDADAIAKEYNVMAYPTFLYFAPDGKLVHLVVGSDSAAAFIAASAKALKPETQYYTRMEVMAKNAGNEPDTLKRLAEEAMEMYDGRYSALFASRYLRAVPSVYTSETLQFLDKFTHSSRDTGFVIFRKNPAKVNQVMGAKYAEKKVEQIIFGEEIYANLKEGITPDFKVIETKLQKKYPDLSRRLIDKFRLQFYQGKDYDQFEKAVKGYIKQYDKQLDPSDLSSFARTVARKAKDTAMLRTALTWSERAVKENPGPDAASVQAMLVYRLGDTATAIRLQEGVISDLAAKEKKFQKEYQEKVLDKMKKGESL
nr:thioredoxin family protein [uncultured Chitinophaga sp.]